MTKEVVHEGKKYESKVINGEMCFVPIKEETIPPLGSLYRMSDLSDIFISATRIDDGRDLYYPVALYGRMDSRGYDSLKKLHNYMIGLGYKVIGTYKDLTVN